MYGLIVFLLEEWSRWCEILVKGSKNESKIKVILEMKSVLIKRWRVEIFVGNGNVYF